MTWPTVTQQPTWGGDSLQIDNLGVLEGGCESDHTRHVGTVAEVVVGQAVKEWARDSTSSGFRSVTWPAVTQLQTWVGNSLQIDNLGVLEGSCESNHARHVATIAEVIICQAMSEWVQVSTSSGFRSVTWPNITHTRKAGTHT